MTSSPLLAIEGAHKQFAGTPVLINVSLDLHAGEVHALMGENGAGKSTLIKLLAGVVPADQMQLTLRGVPVNFANPQAAFHHGLRFIHQELNIVPQLSLAENLFISQPYPTRLGFFVDWRRLNSEAARLLNELGVIHLKPTDRMAHLSPGDQMLVKIASAFVGENALIYIMDEPTAALSREETAMLFGVIRRLRERGCAILYVSHHMEDIFKIADCVTVLRDGRVVTTQPIAEVTADGLVRAMTGRQLQQMFPARETPLSTRRLLRVESLGTDFLHDISFDLHEGEIVGVAGLIGAGRTTLLRTLMGADRIRRGVLHLDDKLLTHDAPIGAWARAIAFVPEERRTQGVILTRSVAHNITLPHLRRVNRAGIFVDGAAEKRASNDLGRAVRLKARNHQQCVRELSGGNQQKVVFARALAQSPRLLLLDEPTRGIDVGAKYDIYGLIRQMSAQGTGILVASSDLLELIGLCDRILILREGKLIEIVAAAGLQEQDLLALCYGEIKHRGD